jgi:glucose/arabinose dehydrogenase
MPAHDDGAAHIGAGVTRPDRITRLRDSDGGDGTAETKSVLPPGLHSPFGMALTGSDLYVADTDAVMRFGHTEGATEIKSSGT